MFYDVAYYQPDESWTTLGNPEIFHWRKIGSGRSGDVHEVQIMIIFITYLWMSAHQ